MSQPNAHAPLFHDRPVAWRGAAVAAGVVALAIASRIEIPMVPVPITMQTYAVCVIGAVYGWRLGAITVLGWLALAAAGLPMLASGKFGLAPFVGPTAGYLFAFPLMALLTGWLAERGWNGSRPGLAFTGMLAANALCLALGGAWLATLVGGEKALALGVTPFIVGGILKSALGALTLRLVPNGSAGTAL